MLYVGFASFAGSQVLHPTWLAGSQDMQGLAWMGRGQPRCAVMLWAVPRSSGGLNELGQPRQNGVKTLVTHRNPLRLVLAGPSGRRALSCHVHLHPCLPMMPMLTKDRYGRETVSVTGVEGTVLHLATTSAQAELPIDQNWSCI